MFKLDISVNIRNMMVAKKYFTFMMDQAEQFTKKNLYLY